MRELVSLENLARELFSLENKKAYTIISLLCMRVEKRGSMATEWPLGDIIRKGKRKDAAVAAEDLSMLCRIAIMFTRTVGL